jgi:hypothetical protein
MKLDTEQWQLVERQLDAQAVSENHADIPELRKKLGDRTFFADRRA